MFKIRAKKVSNSEYLIEVWDEDLLVQTKLAKGIAERDRIVFDLCDLHNIVDVEYINMTKIQQDIEEVDSEIPVLPYTDAFQLEDYFDSHNVEVFDRILNAVEEGINTKKKKIKLFQISNTGVFIDSLKRDWPSGIRVAHQYFLEIEDYEKCNKCISLLDKLKSKL
jgi:hypothetical protein